MENETETRNAVNSTRSVTDLPHCGLSLSPRLSVFGKRGVDSEGEDGRASAETVTEDLVESRSPSDMVFGRSWKDGLAEKNLRSYIVFFVICKAPCQRPKTAVYGGRKNLSSWPR